MSLEIIREAFSEMLQVKIVTKAELVAAGIRVDQQAAVPGNTPQKITVQQLFQLTYRVKGTPSQSSLTLPGPDKAIGYVVIKFLQGNTISVPIAADTTVACVQLAVATHVDYSQEEVRLIYGGTTITDQPDLELRERGIAPNDVLCAIIVSTDDPTSVAKPSLGSAAFYIDEDLLHPGYDFDFTHINDAGMKFMRGGYEYKRPCGWRRFALRVLGIYGGGNEQWLGSTGRAGIGEWPVSYHGMQLASGDPSGGDHEANRDRFGRGHYSSPNVALAEKYGTKFTFDGIKYVMVLQNRINPDTMKIINKDRTRDIDEYWITLNEEDIRPYGICIKKI